MKGTEDGRRACWGGGWTVEVSWLSGLITKRGVWGGVEGLVLPQDGIRYKLTAILAVVVQVVCRAVGRAGAGLWCWVHWQDAFRPGCLGG